MGAGAVRDAVRTVTVLVGAGFRRHSRYHGAIIGGAAANTMFGLLRASLVAATITTAGGRLGGYAIATGVTYVWVTQALIGPAQVFYWEDLAVRVRTGDIVVDLARPLDLQAQFGALDLGRALAVTIPRAAPPLTIGALTFGLSLPGDPWAYLAGGCAVLLGVGVSFACRYLVNLCAIWLLDIRGVATVYFTVSTVLCGLVVPVHWFPDWLAALDAATPFPSILQTPADVLTGRVVGPAAGRLLAVQVSWLAAVLLAGRLVQQVGLRRLVVQGG
ncbi:MAG TPA: ABC-2 family transporter protein [Kineosporiaceae bacterium]